MYLDDADQNPDRHALDGYQDTRRDQDLKALTFPNSKTSVEKSRPCLRRRTQGPQSVYAERVVGGNYLDFDIDRESRSPATASRSGTFRT